LEVKSQRLELIAGTPETVRAELGDRPHLASLLRARIPEGWPPPLNDEESMNYSLRFLEADSSRIGWGPWYLVLPESGKRARLLIGYGGFKGKPSADGMVEIGYSVMEEHQRRGYGTEAAGALIAWAFSHREVTRVIAETLPALRPSLRVMERNGMRSLGAGSEPGVIRYGITREEFEKR
jgi:RimJ/RimL family protein N-acetyltransferase